MTRLNRLPCDEVTLLVGALSQAFVSPDGAASQSQGLHEAFKGQFVAGSTERDMLSQIGTGPKRRAPAQAVVQSAEVLSTEAKTIVMHRADA